MPPHPENLPLAFSIELMKTILFFPVPVGFILTIMSIVFMLFPAKKPNHFYGYRTPQAFRDQKSWDFAQRFAARLMTLFAFCGTVICGIAYFAVHRHGVKIENPVIVCIYHAMPAIAALLPIVLTEIALARMKKL